MNRKRWGYQKEHKGNNRLINPEEKSMRWKSWAFAEMMQIMAIEDVRWYKTDSKNFKTPTHHFSEKPVMAPAHP